MPCATPVELIEGCVDDHTIEEDGIEGFMMLQCAKDSRRSIPLLAGRRILTVY